MSTATTRRQPTKKTLHPSYLALIEEFPLRPIRDDKTYEIASNLMTRLVVRGEDKLIPGERDYLDALELFIESYPPPFPPLPKSTPIKALKHLMEQREMKPKDLADVIGFSGTSLILNGKREISKGQARNSQRSSE